VRGMEDRDPLDAPMTRRSVVRGGLGAVALFVGSPLLTACGDDDGGGGSGGGGSGGGGGGGGALQKLRDQGSARMGVTETLPSSGFENGKGVGVFPEIGEIVMKEIGVGRIEPVQMQFGAQVPALVAKRIDMAAGGLYYTDERCKAIEFSNTQLAYLESLAVAKGNPLKLKTYEDIAKGGHKVGLVAGTFEIELAKQGGVEDANIQRYPDIAAMFEALKAERVQAGGYDNVTIEYFAELPQYSGDVDAAPGFDPVEDDQPSSGVAGMGLQKGATDLRDAFNEAQAKLFEQGRFDDIYAKWKVPEENVRLTREARPAHELCAAAAG
jgi:polar amino acid transport system substrate-binding protein